MAPAQFVRQCLTFWGQYKDMQVPAAIDSAALKQAAEISGNSEVKVVIFPDANHLFQKANSGMPQEYSALPKQFLPGFLDSIEAWINKLN